MKQLINISNKIYLFLIIFLTISCKSINTQINSNSEKLSKNFELYYYAVGEADSLSDQSRIQLSYSHAISDLARTLTDCMESALTPINHHGEYNDLITECVNNAINQSKIIERKTLENGNYRTLISFDASLLPALSKETGLRYINNLEKREKEIKDKLQALISEVNASITDKTTNKEYNTAVEIKEIATNKAEILLNEIEEKLEIINIDVMADYIIRYLNSNNPNNK